MAYRQSVSIHPSLCLAFALLLPACFAADDSRDLAASGSGSPDANSSGASGYPGDGGTGGDDGGYGDDVDDGTTPDDDTAEGTTGDAPECDADTPVTLFLSPDDSNSMSSPVQAREAVLSQWASLSSVPIRTWEFFNYYSFAYPPAEPGALEVSTSLYRDSADPEGEYVLQIGVSSETITNDERAPLNITLVLDESGSMGGAPMDMLKESCRAIAHSLREGDIISMVTWDTSNAIVLDGYAVAGSDDPTLLAKIDALEAGGGTDLHGGLTAGYALAQEGFDPGRVNRIVLMSDGGANAGITDIELISAHAGGNDEDGIYMVGVGVGGEGTYRDQLMDAVTDAGKGASVFVPSSEEAWSIFGTNFVNTLAVAARDVQVRLDLPPGFEIVKFSGEEYSADPSEVEPQHLAPNDAMVFHQRIATCAPELVDDDAQVGITVRFQDPITFEAKETSHTAPFAELLAGDHALLLKGAAMLAYTEALKAAKSGTPEEKALALEEALAAIALAESALEGDVDLAEIHTVLTAL
jgi:Ca-activated chloride channel homolog